MPHVAISCFFPDVSRTKFSWLFLDLFHHSTGDFFLKCLHQKLMRFYNVWRTQTEFPFLGGPLQGEEVDKQVVLKAFLFWYIFSSSLTLFSFRTVCVFIRNSHVSRVPFWNCIKSAVDVSFYRRYRLLFIQNRFLNSLSHSLVLSSFRLH